MSILDTHKEQFNLSSSGGVELLDLLGMEGFAMSILAVAGQAGGFTG